jgi:hypothetical protein
MEFLKKHYEKIILSVVLLGLGAAAYWLPLAVRQAGESAHKPAEVTHSKNSTLPSLSFSNVDMVVAATTNPPVVNFTGEHRVLNPLTWKKMPDGSVKRFLVEGPDALTIRTNPRPIYANLVFDRPSAGVYYINIQQPGKSRTVEYLKPGEKSKTGLFTLRDVKGSGDDVSEVVVELAENQETLTLVKNQPKQIIDGYSADLRYEPENVNFQGKRVGDSLSFGDATYKIVYIGANAVRVTDQTGKQTTIKLTGTP